ncbi:MAG TPA: glycosyltransferase [Pirellulales bacterium]|nr:glycosyltransferase [Pirellulales bacterium]
MRASIIVASHQEGERLWRTLASCFETTAGFDREIIVADDASFDGSVEEASRRFPQIRLFRNDERQGASPTKALGARHARGETLVFLDGHTKPEPGAIQRLVEDIEQLKGEAIVTPAIAALDVPRWKNAASQIGHGYFLDLEEFHCGWLPLGELRGVWKGSRKFYESPALIGCALAVGRELYESLGGFDSHMRYWGVEDLDFGLKSWLMGCPILHDPDAVIGHRFRAAFDNFSVPMEHLLANQLRMARKNFTEATWSDWVDRCRARHVGRIADHPEGLWALAWESFQADRASVEHERTMLLGHRRRDEFWYAERFGLEWPRLAATAAGSLPQALFAEPSPSPSPPPCNVQLTAHRTGNYFGQPVPDEIKRLADANKYLILTNNDRDRTLLGPGLVYDFDIPTADLTGVDDDLARITLRNLNTSSTSGSIAIVLSNPDAVRLFKADGTRLNDLSVDLANPNGDLAGLATGSVDVWFDALIVDPDFVFSLVYMNESGGEVCRDEIHARLADFSMQDSSGLKVDFTSAYPKETLLVAGQAVFPPNEPNLAPDKPTYSNAIPDPLPDYIYYRLRIDNLPTSLVTLLRVSSNDVPSDFYDDTFPPSDSATVSSMPAVVYWAAASDVMTTSQKTILTSTLEINVVHGRSATALLTTLYDSFNRVIPAIEITVTNPSQEPFAGQAGVEFDPVIPIELHAAGTLIPPPDSVLWQLTASTPTVNVSLTGTTSPDFGMTVDDLGRFVIDMGYTLGGQTKYVRIRVDVGSVDLNAPAA